LLLLLIHLTWIMGKQKFYVVWVGKTPGVYRQWKECEEQIRGVDGAVYKSFADEQLALKAFNDDYKKYIGKSFGRLSEAEKEKFGRPIGDSISVDAACSGNPGIMEYRGVDTLSGAELFRRGPFPDATVNVGEYLAIVHGLAYLAQRNFDFPVYSDSLTAIKWVRDKHPRTRLQQKASNEKVFELLDRATRWLKENEYPNRVIKWETAAWGEIPADFGRK